MSEKLDEAVSLESTITAISSILSTIPDLYGNMKAAMHNFDYDIEDEKASDSKLNFVLGGYKTRWMNKNYIGKGNLKDQLQLLINFMPKRTGNLKQFLMSLSTNAFNKVQNTETYGILSNQLPQLLSELNIDKLSQVGKMWTDQIVKFNQDRQAYKAALYKSADTQTQPQKSQVPGQQYSQVEQIVNDVLNKVPKKDAAEIRYVLSRADNKLAVLQQELQKRNIHIEGISYDLANMINEVRIIELMKILNK
jgi:hypothetical protein